jgi:voltage-gated potassium channel
MRPGRERLEMMLEAAVVVAAVATIPVVIAEARGDPPDQIVIVNWIIWIVFLLEFLIMLVLAPPSRATITRHLFNLAIVALSFPLAPAALGAVRLARVARLARLVRLLAIGARGIRALQLIFLRRGLLMVLVVTLAIILIGGGIMTSEESQTVRGGYWSGVWWAVVTLTTVGYGDIAPTTLAGRLIAGILMFSGIGLFSTLAAAVAAYFVGEDDSAGLHELEHRLDRIEAMLAQISDRQTQLIDQLPSQPPVLDNE